MNLTYVPEQLRRVGNTGGSVHPSTPDRGRMPITDWNDVHSPPRNENGEHNTRLSNDDGSEIQNTTEAKIEELTKTLESLKHSSEDHTTAQKDLAKNVQDSFKTLDRRITDVFDVLERENRLIKDGAAERYSVVRTYLSTLSEGLLRTQDSVTTLRDYHNLLSEKAFSMEALETILGDMVEAHKSNLEEVVGIVLEKDLTAEETVKVFESLLSMLPAEEKAMDTLYTKEFAQQLDRFRAITEKYTTEQATLANEVQGLKAKVEEFEKANEFLVAKVSEQESQITALMDENWTLKLQMSSALYSIRLLEDKVDHLDSR